MNLSSANSKNSKLIQNGQKGRTFWNHKIHETVEGQSEYTEQGNTELEWAESDLHNSRTANHVFSPLFVGVSHEMSRLWY